MADKYQIEDIKTRIQKGFLYDNYGTVLPIGFILDHTLNNQRFFYLCQNAGRYLNDHGMVEFSAYIINNTRPSFWPPFGLYLTDELRHFTGHAIATSLGGINYLCSNHHFASRSLYVYDIKELEQAPGLAQTIIDFGINVFTRNEDYAKVLTNLGIPFNKIIVPDFNIEKIVEMINGLSKKD